MADDKGKPRQLRVSHEGDMPLFRTNCSNFQLKEGRNLSQMLNREVCYDAWCVRLSVIVHRMFMKTCELPWVNRLNFSRPWNHKVVKVPFVSMPNSLCLAAKQVHQLVKSTKNWTRSAHTSCGLSSLVGLQVTTVKWQVKTNARTNHSVGKINGLNCLKSIFVSPSSPANALISMAVRSCNQNNLTCK